MHAVKTQDGWHGSWGLGRPSLCLGSPSLWTSGRARAHGTEPAPWLKFDRTRHDAPRHASAGARCFRNHSAWSPASTSHAASPWLARAPPSTSPGTKPHARAASALAAASTEGEVVEVGGVVQKVWFKSTETGYAVLRLRADSPRGAEAITVVGTLAHVAEGQALQLQGSWKRHPQYGRQLAVSEAVQVAPRSDAELALYLASGVLPGVGQVTAKALVETFGVEIESVLSAPDAVARLRRCPGVGAAKAARIKAAWDALGGSRAGFLFAKGAGVPALVAQALAEELGSGVEAALRCDPYAALSGRGLGLARLDAVAARLACRRDLASRAGAGTLECLGAAANAEGHSYLPWRDLQAATLRTLGGSGGEPCASGALAAVVADLAAVGELALRRADGAEAPEFDIGAGARRRRGLAPGDTLRDAIAMYPLASLPLDARCYLPSLAAAEAVVAAAVAARAAAWRGPGPREEAEVSAWLRRHGAGAALGLSPGQAAAVRAAASAPLAVLTGGPGCGKTHALAAVVRLWRAQGKRVRVCAPTGRAAQRMGSVAGVAPCTVHRLLRYVPRRQRSAAREVGAPAGDPGAGRDPADDLGERGRFEHCAAKPLAADAVLVDEASMLSLPLAAALMQALPPTCQLVLVGDVDQLPSIGPGTVLNCILTSGLVPVTDLRQVFRQAATSAIVGAALAVQAGVAPRLPALARPGDVIAAAGGSAALLLPVPRAGDLVAAARDVVAALTRRGADRSEPAWASGDVQVISPMRAGPVGTGALNPVLQGLLNPGGPDAVGGGSGAAQSHGLRPGDRVMQLVNDYDREVFNGDQGTVVSWDPAGKVVKVQFPHLVEAAAAERAEAPASFAARAGANPAPDGVCSYQGSEAGALGLAYAITVHKAQGGEAPCVVLVLAPGHGRMLDRRLVYTALTRAKKLLVVVQASRPGEPSPLELAVQRREVGTRHSGLGDRLAALGGDARRHTPDVCRARGRESRCADLFDERNLWQAAGVPLRKAPAAVDRRLLALEQAGQRRGPTSTPHKAIACADPPPHHTPRPARPWDGHTKICTPAA
ncbi:hypothetical protein ACKKBG_A20460 [Auxenochlorella protothecoides x Auxenochlorella symbiontica]